MKRDTIYDEIIRRHWIINDIIEPVNIILPEIGPEDSDFDASPFDMSTGAGEGLKVGETVGF